ncbi:hypothetical protein J1N35_037381 [Gossypium stocksii]|uniref:Uncharacterized protein n=1 Tax=Gossypium stocksii TaxID=47602 RepID=A0A9D3UK11_9ROSI|nr:hypothetical protein J1N35_037381 [Gossypium stocksii]
MVKIKNRHHDERSYRGGHNKRGHEGCSKRDEARSNNHKVHAVVETLLYKCSKAWKKIVKHLGVSGIHVTNFTYEFSKVHNKCSVMPLNQPKLLSTDLGCYQIQTIGIQALKNILLSSLNGS